MIVEQFTEFEDPFWDHHWQLGDRVHVILAEGSNGKAWYWSAYVVDDLGQEVAMENGTCNDMESAELEAKAKAIDLMISTGLHGAPDSSVEFPSLRAVDPPTGKKRTTQRKGKARRK